MIKVAESAAEAKREGRHDSKMFNVLISDRRIKTASKFKVAEIPHPFTSREEYEQSMRVSFLPRTCHNLILTLPRTCHNLILTLPRTCHNINANLHPEPVTISTLTYISKVPIGDEWNASHVVQKNTKPEILKRAGRIIETPKLSQKKQRVFKP